MQSRFYQTMVGFSFVGATLQITILSICGVLLGSSDDLEAVPESAVVNQFGGIPEINFDQWVFQGVGNDTAARDRIKARLKLQLDDLDRTCGLTDEQKQKLTLAARGDIKHFFDQVEQTRSKFREVRRDPNDINEIMQDLQPLRAKMSDLFGKDSLYAKVLRKTLTEEQATKYRGAEQERDAWRYRATVAVALAALEKSIPLRHSQRQALMEVLVQETRPPRSFGSNDYSYVMYQLSRLPEDKIKPLLDARQWALLEQWFERQRELEQMLIQQGVLAREDVQQVRRPPEAKQRDESPADETRPEQPMK